MQNVLHEEAVSHANGSLIASQILIQESNIPHLLSARQLEKNRIWLVAMFQSTWSNRYITKPGSEQARKTDEREDISFLFWPLLQLNSAVGWCKTSSY